MPTPGWRGVAGDITFAKALLGGGPGREGQASDLSVSLISELSGSDSGWTSPCEERVCSLRGPAWPGAQHGVPLRHCPLSKGTAGGDTTGREWPGGTACSPDTAGTSASSPSLLGLGRFSVCRACGEQPPAARTRAPACLRLSEVWRSRLPRGRRPLGCLRGPERAVSVGCHIATPSGPRVSFAPRLPGTGAPCPDSGSGDQAEAPPSPVEDTRRSCLEVRGSSPPGATPGSVLPRDGLRFCRAAWRAQAGPVSAAWPLLTHPFLFSQEFKLLVVLPVGPSVRTRGLVRVRATASGAPQQAPRRQQTRTGVPGQSPWKGCWSLAQKHLTQASQQKGPVGQGRGPAQTRVHGI